MHHEKLLKALVICNILYGFQGMKSDSLEVITLLRVTSISEDMHRTIYSSGNQQYALWFTASTSRCT